MNLFLCKPGFEKPLIGEILQEWTSVKPVALMPGLVSAEFPHNAKFPDESSTGNTAHDWSPVLAWAKQTLPNAASLNADSIKTWATTIGVRIIDELKNFDGPWRLHLFAYPTSEAEITAKRSQQTNHPQFASARRAHLVQQAVYDFLKQKQKRLFRTLISDSSAVWLPNERWIQVALVTVEHGWWSHATLIEVRYWRHCISTRPAGMIEIPNDREAPARAFAKLAEAELHLGRMIKPKEICVDLGASPGSWTWHAMKHGAKITAVDRSPLRDDLMRHTNVKFQRGDAFKFLPEKPVDWLLCDVAAFPDRIIQLLDDWLGKKLCRNFVVTIKFRGSEDYKLLHDAKQTLHRHGYDYLLRNLNANKNEITAMGSERQK